MEWLNEPPHWQEADDTLTVTTGPDSDFWRVTHYGFIRDSGHVRYTTLQGDGTVAVKVQGEYRDLYDQAGLMIRIDAQHWIKCGIELVDGVQQISAVVTREFSDWSVRPLVEPPVELTLRLTRSGDTVTVDYALDNGPLTMLRLAYFPPHVPVQVGMMCASPQGTGFPVVFRAFQVTPAAT